MKSYPFCLRQGRVVVEYIGQDINVALATKTSYELGLREKPDRVRYRLRAELATIEKADYMACNPLFNQFLALRNKPHEDAVRQIQPYFTSEDGEMPILYVSMPRIKAMQTE